MTPRVYVAGPLHAGQVVELAAAAEHHARVLRLRPGEILTLFDGSGGEWAGRLVSKSAVQLLEKHDVERESPLEVTLIQGVSSGERMDYTVQKAVELGVAAIQPVITKKGVVRLEGSRAAARAEHWRKIAIAACEQCGRNRVPQLLPLLAFHQYRPPMEGTRLLLSPQGRALRELQLGNRIWIAAGPMITMMIDGKMKTTSGNSILVGILAAFSSARTWRL